MPVFAEPQFGKWTGQGGAVSAAFAVDWQTAREERQCQSAHSTAAAATDTKTRDSDASTVTEFAHVAHHLAAQYIERSVAIAV